MSVQRGKDLHAGVTRLVVYLTVAIFVLGFFLIKPSSFFGDEGFHIDQVNRFLRFQWTMSGSLTMLPGYHALIAIFSWPMGISPNELNGMRIVNIVFSILSIIAFAGALRAVNPQATSMRVIQYSFFPILFPFFFLLYTDVTAVGLALFTMWAAARKRPFTAAAISVLSIVVRQNNIIWVIFFGLWMLRDVWMNTRVRTPKNLLRQSWPILAAFGVVLALFAVFVIWNDGIAVGDRGAHPGGFHVGNVYFGLLLSAGLLLPLHVFQAKDLAKRLLSPWTITVLCAMSAVYFMFFINDHGYNQGWDSPFFRNRILTYMVSTETRKALILIPILLSTVSFACTRFVANSKIPLAIFSVLSLIPFWLIEQRYLLIPYALFLLFREERNPWQEEVITIFSVAATIALFIPIFQRTFFL